MKIKQRKADGEESMKTRQRNAEGEEIKRKGKRGSFFWNSRTVQNAVCVISFTVIVLDFLAMLLYNAFFNNDRINTVWDILQMVLTADYEDSEWFNRAVLEEGEVLVNRQYAEALFGEDFDVSTDGMDRELDLGYSDYIAGEDELTGITYTIHDLLNWKTIESCPLDLESFEILKGLKEDDPSGVFVNEDYSSREGRKFNCIVNEPFLTAEGKSLYEYVDNPSQMEDYYEKLTRTLSYIKVMYYYYLLYPTDTSLQAAVFSEREESAVFSTFNDINFGNEVSGWEIESELSRRVKQSGCYAIYSPGEGAVYSYETNMTLNASDLSCRTYIAAGDTLYLWVDTSYPAEDLFVQNRESFYELVKYNRIFIGILLFSLILFLTALVRRTMLEGREGEPVRRICGWKTVFLFPAGGVVCWGLIGAAVWTFERIARKMDLSVGAVVCFMISGGIYAFLFLWSLLYFYLEIVRRLKDRTFYKKSLLCMIVKEMKRLMLLVNGRVRWVIGYLAYLFLNLLAVLYGDNNDSEVTVIVAGVLDLVIGAYFLRYFKELDLLRGQMCLIAEGKEREALDVSGFHMENKTTAEIVNEMDLGIARAVENSLRDERMKVELITNVSHDIKTPLTSVITYVDLLKNEPLQTEKEKQYVGILAEKSERLKQLIDDLMESSKITSGNISVVPMKLSVGELAEQLSAEYETKLADRQLILIRSLPEEPACFTGDSRHVWRVFSNLFSNVCKYAMPGTRVFLEAEKDELCGTVSVHIKNISERCLNISPEELTERFVRGDESRNTEGNGLGLSIAKSLMEAMQGSLEIFIDGDLFKVILRFPI